ncbi:conoporin-Cn1-like [Mya arenaria]|uniref:conoporin-Cn1-like n=1 Tax=Mya arenaria TaxID=6604 RepID=UPI0022E69588|nr:conoporin-Cn1-like [Mya arenaria]
MMIEAIESEGDIQYVIDEDLGLEKKTSMMIEAIESEGDIQVAEVKETGLEQTTNLLELSNQLSAMDYDEQTTEKIIDQLIQDNYRVTCFFNVQNRTANMIDDGRICCTWGNVVVPPTLADPWKNNIVATRKAIHCATGTSGTLSYKIHSDPPRRLVIKWECPFNFDIHSNMLAVGISQQTVECHDNNWYNTMKTEGTHTVDEHFGYDLHYYISSDVRQVFYTDGKYTVYGTMSSCHKAQVLIWLKRNQLQIKRN